MKKQSSFLLALVAIVSLFNVGCKNQEVADMVIYGTIRTAEVDAPTAEAIAIKDGKYIYVGDKAGAAAFIKEGVTEVVDHTGKGMVMPGCTEGHAHYLTGNLIVGMKGVIISHTDDDVKSCLQKLKTAYDEAKASGKTSIIGFGWNYVTFLNQGFPSREQLDAISPDIPVLLLDSEGHKGLANTACLCKAGVMDEKGNVLISKLRGGEICMDAKGKPNGLLLEQASTFVRGRGLDFANLVTDEVASQAVLASQQMLLANGYTAYMDGWSNSFGEAVYPAAEILDQQGKLNILLGMSYEFESTSSDVDAHIAHAVELKKYSKGHVNANFIKLFIDGTVEGGTGLTLDPYPDGHEGISNWEEDEVADITAKANAQGLTMHIHTMGDKAAHRAVNAFVNNGTKEARNTIVHVRNLPDEDFQRIADHDIVAVVGILWHLLADEMRETVKKLAPANVALKSYPMKSYFDHGAIITSHCDFPATAGSPYDPFSIMEIAVSGSILNPATGQNTTPWWPEELITREQALQALTINGAYQLHCEQDRGSIKVGKYADFILVDEDVFLCPVTDIHKAKVLATYFEGKKVFAL